MEVVAIVLPIALLMGCLAVWTFIRCVRRGQYDDLDTPPLRMLADEEPSTSRVPGSSDRAGSSRRRGQLSLSNAAADQ